MTTATLTRTLDDEINVELVDGQPAVFWWRRFPYVVEGQPMLFYRRRPGRWWAGEARSDRLDDEFWRVNAARDGSAEEPQLYDLKWDGERWSLVLRW
ncbi:MULTISPECIES: hypothetical protein [unclassified Pseudoclavibacter]|uniref:hypothetical protein n=1 Tax=unclassified Pseudoclavibacter TaxID=2615177 RepID=UPI001BA5589C|nr:hypothetical protein [Pseudoclavibacter sp. Marseille-Q4354]MBS3180038.1 hypothetical protein [Pseudoclavibacter sp. Marseille-Q4354]